LMKNFTEINFKVFPLVIRDLANSVFITFCQHDSVCPSVSLSLFPLLTEGRHTCLCKFV
jgi:hypothetical protein